MLEFLGEFLVEFFTEAFGWLIMGGVVGLWCWLTEERKSPHTDHVAAPEMATIRIFARIFLGLWLVLAFASAIHWFDPWTDSARNIALGIAGFFAGPTLMVWGTGLWRDRVVARLRKGG